MIIRQMNKRIGCGLYLIREEQPSHETDLPVLQERGGYGMFRKSIRNLSSSKNIPPRLFDVLVDGNQVDLEVKTGKGEYERIPWEDVKIQVEIAREQNK